MSAVLVSFAQCQREARLADYLVRVRQSVPERRPVVKYRSGIVWKQDAALLAQVLAAKAKREVDV